MAMKRFGFYQLLVSFALLFSACAKEEPVFPAVRILSPSEGQSFRFRDTLVLTFHLEDAERHRINILDGARALSLEQELLSSSPQQYEYLIYCNDPYLASGSYQIQVRAENQGEVKSAFRQFQYQAEPRRRTGFATLKDRALWLTDENASGRQLALDQTQFDLAFRASGQEVVLWSPRNSRMVAYDITSGQRNYQADYPLPGQQNQYDAQFIGGRDLFMAQSDGQVYPLNDNGLAAGTVLQLPQGWRCSAGTYRQGDLLLGLHQASRNEVELHKYQGQQGGLLQSHFIGSGRMLGLCLYDEQRSFFCLDQNGQLKAGLYNEQSEQSSLFLDLGGEQFKALTSDANGSVYLLTDAALYRYRESVSNQLEKINLAALPTDIQYDRTEGELLLLFYNNIQALNDQGNTVFRAGVLAGSKKMSIIYNK